MLGVFKISVVYKIGDYVSSLLAWFLFFIWRKSFELWPFRMSQIFDDENLYFGLLAVSSFWIIFYFVFDKYKNIVKLSILATISRTCIIGFMGCLLIFFTLMVDDTVLNYITFFNLFWKYFVLHVGITIFFRILVLFYAKKQIAKGAITFPTLLVGGSKKALALINDVANRKSKMGFNFVGYVEDIDSDNNEVKNRIPYLGSFQNISPLLTNNKEITDVIVAIENQDKIEATAIFDMLFQFSKKIMLHVAADMYDIMLGKVKMNHVYGAVLIHIEQELMPKWQRYVKRLMDVAFSVLALVVLSPLLLIIAWKVKHSSEGPVFYKQSRVGLNGKEFEIIKFRSMITNAEKNGPSLSIENDNRITDWGRIMRKWRLDELPQFWNVVIGDMSLVGPRPERRYYIDQIVKTSPHYKQLLKVRPGITSWGQVKFGYASSVNEMIQRLKFDLLYIENMSLALDIKIIIYTLVVLVQGKGK